MKIIDKINKSQEQKRPFFSFEYFPPKTDEGTHNLFDRLDRMASFGPAWIDVTWGAGGSTASKTLEICCTSQQFIGLETMMHLTCTNMPRQEIDEALAKAHAGGIHNILALRGDPPRGEEWKQMEGGFAHAADLVRHIRAQYGNHFGIAVAGYPESHTDSESKQKDLEHLKAKIDAGADLIITQLFYDTALFLQFVNDCREIGITVPILPGIMPLQTYAGFRRMTQLCKTHVPEFINEALEPIQNDDAAVKAYGVELGIKMCKELLDAGTPGLHFYTLNLEKSVIQILDGLGMIAANTLRSLPWRASAHTERKAKEDVRPIFWSNRPRSYMARTSSWDDFPNGRWGDARSPAYGDLSEHYHLAGAEVGKIQGLRQKWGEAPKTEQEIWNVFAGFCKGEVDTLPWNDTVLSPETTVISASLVALNSKGVLTINSQPRVNAASSTDPLFGWGGADGYVYQKAYLEFFAPPAVKEAILSRISAFPSLTYHCLNVKGDSVSNTSGTTAVTWGAFYGKEIMQPTVVDSNAFLVWKDEAFSLWKTAWAVLYEQGSASRALLDRIHDEYYLINIVDNDYISGDIFKIFEGL
eukprot:TRINITY_DN580_c0_g1_i1.p1 TRINITY_DN580_c0_g1~~TRINITY_DN580_c0_g1_i1.p1  ORF type:complete len:584 (-),score=100.59 TRINITY_DN580_c0_g1_i1:78-1829(-)